MVKEHGFPDVLFIGDDTILLNNLIYHLFLDKEISVIFAPTWEEGIKCMEKNEIKLMIVDSILISKIKPSAVISLIRKLKIPVLFINTKPHMWIYKMADRTRNLPVIIYKQPLMLDNFLKTIQMILKR